MVGNIIFNLHVNKLSIATNTGLNTLNDTVVADLRLVQIRTILKNVRFKEISYDKKTCWNKYCILFPGPQMVNTSDCKMNKHEEIEASFTNLFKEMKR